MDKARFALSSLLIQELVYRLVSGRFSQIGVDDSSERLTQMMRTTLDRIVLGAVSAKLVHCQLDTCEAHNGVAVGK